jgi:ribonuclease HI
LAIIAYTDGSSLGNPGPGGYGAILLETEKKFKKEFSEGFRLTTNNRMELMAVIVTLSKLKKAKTEITIFTDSKYVCDAVEKKWVFGWEKKGFKGKKNQDLWMKFLVLFRRHKVSFKWVKGHAGNEFNERADQLAVASANSKSLKIDTGFESAQNESPGLF